MTICPYPETNYIFIYKQYNYTYNYLGKLDTKTVAVKNQDIAGYDNTPTALNLTTVYTYDANGNVLTATDPNGTTVTYTYDLINRQLRASQPGVDEDDTAVTIATSRTYDWAGNVLTSTDALANVTEYTYDNRGFLSKVTNPLDGVQYYVYDWAGRKIAEVSPNNYSVTDLANLNRTEYVYDNMGRVLQVKQIYQDPNDNNSWKEVVTKDCTYDNNGNLTYAQDALGYQGSYGTLYEYNKANRLIKERDPESQLAQLAYSMQYAYDAIGRLTTKTDANGVATAYTYNDDGKVLTVTVGLTQIQSNTYDWQGNPLTQTDGEGNVTTYVYNDLNMPRSVTTAGDDSIESYSVSYRYNVLGLLVEQLDSMGKQVINTYDRQGHLLSTTEQKSDVSETITVSYRYDESCNLRYQTDGNGNVTQYTYDELNRQKTKTISVTNINSVTTQQTTSYDYDANSNLISGENWLGNVYTYTYDPLNRLMEKQDPYANLIEKLEYNDNSAQITSTDALDQTTEYVYDRNGRLTATVDALSHSQQQGYDGAGNIISKTDANGNATTYAYDDFNRLTAVVNALEETTSYTYDANGNMLTQTDGKGNVTSMEYNCRNLLTALIEDDGITGQSYTYNADGSVLSKLDRNGVTTEYEYDIHGRLLSQSAGGEEISYTYDANGNQLSITDGTGTTTRVYDELGRAIQKTVPNIGTSTYLYDVTAGVPTYYVGETTTDPKGNISTKVFDRTGRLSQVKVGSDTTSYTYLANGNRESMTYPNGIVAEYTYYADNRLHTLANKQGVNIIEAFSYAYDAAGNLQTKLDAKGTTSYTYDELNRLESVTEPGGKVTEYTFDAAGNRTSEEVTEASTQILTNYTYDELNRLIDTDEILSSSANKVTSYYYDANGNMTGSQVETVTDYDAANVASLSIFVLGKDAPDDGTALYEYDAYSRMISVYEGEYVMRNTYNGDGLRVKKEVTQEGETETTQYLYDYDKVVLETDGNGAQTAYNVYGNDTLISRTAAGVTLYYLYNGHGDVTALTTGNGTVVAGYYYDAFGEVVEETGVCAGDNPYRYAGYTYDTESDLYYLQARYYAPKIARFMSEDTYLGSTADPLSLNLYTYCSNNPLVYFDPTGHDAYRVMPNGAIEKTLENGDVYYISSESSKYDRIYTEMLTANGNGGEGVPAGIGIPSDFGDPGSYTYFASHPEIDDAHTATLLGNPPVGGIPWNFDERSPEDSKYYRQLNESIAFYYQMLTNGGLTPANITGAKEYFAQSLINGGFSEALESAYGLQYAPQFIQEGPNAFENINGTIYKNGQQVSSSAMIYVPGAVGGQRETYAAYIAVQQKLTEDRAIMARVAAASVSGHINTNGLNSQQIADMQKLGMLGIQLMQGSGQGKDTNRMTNEDAMLYLNNVMNPSSTYTGTYRQAISDTLWIWGLICPVADVADCMQYAFKGDWRNAGWAVLGIIPIAGDAVKTVKIGRAASKVVVIGEGMGDIKTAAKQLQAEGINAKWYQAWSKNFPNNRPMTPDELNVALTRNQRWIDSKIKQGYDIYDIGTDPLRTTRSPFYELEQSRINKYGYPTIDITGRRP